MRLGDTPVPIPNTMVKTQAADGTALETVWESRWLPELQKNILPLDTSIYLIRLMPVVLFLVWRPPALPHRLQCSTIGRLRLNRRVRDGNGCFPQAHRHQKSLSYKVLLDNSTVKHIQYSTFSVLVGLIQPFSQPT